MRRAVAEDPVRASGSAHGTACVAPYSIVEPWVCCNCCARAGGTRTSILVSISARVVRSVVVDPVVRGRLAVSKLRSLALADDDRATVYEALHRGCGHVLGREEVVEGAIATAGGQALDIEEVFDAPAGSGERLLWRGREVQPRRHCGTDSRSLPFSYRVLNSDAVIDRWSLCQDDYSRMFLLPSVGESVSVVLVK